MEYVLFSILGILSVLGLVLLMRQLQQFFLCPKRKCTAVTVLPVTGQMPELELQLRGLYADLQWNTACRPVLLLVDMGAKQEELRICQAFCREHQEVRLCRIGELTRAMEQTCSNP